MLYAKLIYFILLVGLYLFSVMYLDSLAVLLFVTMLCLPVVLFVVHRITSLFVSFSIKSPPSILAEQDQSSYFITANNRSPFPLISCVAFVEITNELLGTRTIKKCRFSSSAHNISTLKQSISFSQSGNYTLCLKEVQAFSFLSLFRKRWKLNKTISLIKLPEQIPVQLERLSPSTVALDGTVYSKTKSGDDPSEVFSLREFRTGDSLRQIHWKLSTKTDTFIVRENSLPLSADIFLLSAIEKETTKDFAKRLEEGLSLLLSISLSLSRQEIGHVFYWYHASHQQYYHRKIETVEESYHAFYEFLKTPLPLELPKKLPDSLSHSSYFKVSSNPTASFTLEDAYEY